MTLEIVIWSLLFAIGVSDAQKHRIPNKAVLLLLIVVAASALLSPSTNGLRSFLWRVGCVCSLLCSLSV